MAPVAVVIGTISFFVPMVTQRVSPSGLTATALGHPEVNGTPGHGHPELDPGDLVGGVVGHDDVSVAACEGCSDSTRTDVYGRCRLER